MNIEKGIGSDVVLSYLAKNVGKAALIGGKIVLEWYGASSEKLQLALKEADDTPVTVTDRESGVAIRKFISSFSDAAINEEESGRTGSGKLVWHIDPLDGTSSFARGQRYSTVGVALYENGLPIVAAIYNPFENELVVAENGGRAYLVREYMVGDGDLYIDSELSVSSKSLAGGIVYLDALFNKKTAPRKLKFIEQLVAFTNGKLGIRMTGSNIDQQRQVAAGRAELTLTDAVGGFYDLAAGALIIEAAGGKMVGMNGEPVNEKTQVAIGGPKSIVEQVLPILQECFCDYDGFR